MESYIDEAELSKSSVMFLDVLWFLTQPCEIDMEVW